MYRAGAKVFTPTRFIDIWIYTLVIEAADNRRQLGLRVNPRTRS